MSLLPRRGPGRHGQPSGVAVHPGWTLSPTSVTEPPAPKPEAARETAVPASRWTSSPAVPAPVLEPVPLAVDEQPAEPPWASEWEAVAATRGTSVTLPTAVAAIEPVSGIPAGWTAPPAGFLPQPHPAPLHVPAPTALDLPIPPADRETATPLAYEAARALPQACPAVPTPPPLPAPAVLPPPPAPPAAPPSRVTSVPASARQLVERAIRSAPAAPVPHRSIVRLGFADASVIDLRPDDPIAKALHTVAAALIGRDRR
ncbi:MAG: hypothetical protein QOE24_1483 [Frankiales bacterium]|nr:hypothetical protein [Frankiales bacterium]